MNQRAASTLLLVARSSHRRSAAAYLDERAMEIRLLSDHRQDLVAERTRAQNRLRWHLLELCPETERCLKRGALGNPRSPDRVDRKCGREVVM